MDRFIDYVKHLTTLSTGSLLLLSGFLEKVFTHPKWRFLVVISIVGFLSTVLACLMLYTYLVKMGKDYVLREWDMGTAAIGAGRVLTFAQLSFSLAILALAVFAIKNLF